MNSLFGTEASAAATAEAAYSPSNNSQSIAMSLEANVSSAEVLYRKAEKIKESKQVKSSKAITKVAEISGAGEAILPENANFSQITDENSLLPVARARSVSGETLDVTAEDLNEISVYVVRKGDTVGTIAEMFDVSSATILSANDLKKNAKLAPDDVLVILPFSGVEHKVLKGETLAGIAKLYKVDALEIIQFNGLTSSKLALGEELFIPNGEMFEPVAKPKTKGTSSGVNIKSLYESTGVQNLAGYFINPVPDLKRKSQGFHGKNAIDLAASKGTKILASAEGRVMLARTGYNGGYGTMIMIEHPNGTRTLYAHLSRLATTTGAQVEQGELIGYVGNTGRSTGPHLHFEVHGARNPGVDNSWK